MAHVNKPTSGRQVGIFVGPGQCSRVRFYTIKLRHFRNIVFGSPASLQEMQVINNSAELCT